jgi:hypothetical protein
VTESPHSTSTDSGAPRNRRRSGRRSITVGLSAFALLLSIAAMGLSLYALSVASSNDSATATPQQSSQSTSAGNTSAGESDAAPTQTASEEQTSEEAATDAPLPTTSANYTVSYDDRRLSLQPSEKNCGGQRTIDLDQPAINVSTGGDFEYQPDYSCEGSPSLEFVSDKVAIVVSPEATPQDCAQAIQLSPASQQITPSQDLVICVVTDGQGAANEPQRAKMARIVVTGVGREQKVAMNVTAWEIPH